MLQGVFAMNKSEVRQKRSTKRRVYESLILLLLTICLFVSATFAWFTDSAFSKGNKVFAGNLYVDVVATLDQMVERYNIDNSNNPINLRNASKDEVFNEIITAYPELEVHDRKYKNPDYIDETETPGQEYLHDYYFIITDKDLAVMNIYNMEPGQVRRAEINYLNTGDLAFSAAGAIKIDVETDETTNKPKYKSYTGLETLNRQFIGDEDIFKNNYVVGEDDKGNPIIDPLEIFNKNRGVKQKAFGFQSADSGNTNSKSYSIYKGFGYPFDNYNDAVEAYEEYEYRFNKLLAMQAKEVASGGNIDKYTFTDKEDDPFYEIESTTLTNYENIGKHLEDILEVYLANSNKTNSSKTKDSHASVVDEGSIALSPLLNTSTRDLILDKNNFFGTVRQFNHLMQFGYSANKDFDYEGYSKKADSDEFILTKSGQDIIRDNCSPEEEYMYLYEDASKNLYLDYQKYLESAGGYCLPRDVLKDEDDCYPYNVPSANSLVLNGDPSKVEVIVSGGGIEEDKTYYANELGSTQLAIYMPENADSRYQNASISLSYGVTATQVEFEMDDTGCMIYDKYKKSQIDVKLGDVLVYTTKSNSELPSFTLPLRAIKVDGDNVTFMMLRDFGSLFAYMMTLSDDEDEVVLTEEEIEQIEKEKQSQMAGILMEINSYLNLSAINSQDKPNYSSTPYLDSNNIVFTDGLDIRYSAIDCVRAFWELILFGSTDSIELLFDGLNYMFDDDDGNPLTFEEFLDTIPKDLEGGILSDLSSHIISSEINQKGYVVTHNDDNSLYSLDDDKYFSNPYNSATLNDDESYSLNSSNGKVRFLTIKDIYDFYGTETTSLTTSQVNKFIYGNEEVYEDAPTVWLGDAALVMPPVQPSSNEVNENLPDKPNLFSLAVAPNGEIRPTQVESEIEIPKSSFKLPVVNETRYVFTVDMSKVNSNSFTTISKELDDVDLSYESDIWGNIKPIKPIDYEDLIDDGDDDSAYVTLYSGFANLASGNAVFYSSNCENYENWPSMKVGSTFRVEYIINEPSGVTPYIKIAFGNDEWYELDQIELDTSINYYEFIITQEIFDKINNSQEKFKILGVNTTLTGIKLSKDDEEEPQDLVYENIWTGSFDINSWSPALTSGTDYVYDWSSVPIGSKLRVEFSILDEDDNNNDPLLRIADGNWTALPGTSDINLTSADTFVEVTITQDILDQLYDPVEYRALVICGCYVNITAIKICKVQNNLQLSSIEKSNSSPYINNFSNIINNLFLFHK